MIAKITRGKSPRAIGVYLHGAGHDDEHHYLDADGHEEQGGVVIGGTLPAIGDTDPRRWVRIMERLNKKRPDIKKPIHQISLRTAPTDRVLTDQEWDQIARQYLAELGLEFNPWVMVRHADDHIHIVAQRINGDGSIWDNKNDRYKSQAATRQIEIDYDLTRVPSKTPRKPAPKAAPDLTHPTERALTQRGAKSWRAQIRAAVNAARETNPTSWKEFRAALASHDVSFTGSESKNDVVYSIAYDGQIKRIRGNSLGARYHGLYLQNQIKHNAQVTAKAKQSAAPMPQKVATKPVQTYVLDSLNPTGTVYTTYDPTKRATAPIGGTLTTLAKTLELPPDQLITIYRGAPKHATTINAGDYVTTHKQLAKDYAGTGKVLKMTVPAAHILDDNDDPGADEYIYRPDTPALESQSGPEPSRTLLPNRSHPKPEQDPAKPKTTTHQEQATPAPPEQPTPKKELPSTEPEPLPELSPVLRDRQRQRLPRL